VGSYGSVFKFSDEVVRTEKLLCEDKTKISIDNSKSSATNGKQNISASKLYTPLTQASNKDDLIRETFAIVEDNWENFPATKLKLPHHKITNNKLTLHISSLQLAFQKAKKQKLIGAPLEHILNHMKNDLNLDSENYAIFGLTQEDYVTYFKESEGEKMKNKEFEAIEAEKIEKAKIEMAKEEESKAKEIEESEAKMAKEAEEAEKFAEAEKMALEEAEKEKAEKEKMAAEEIEKMSSDEKYQDMCNKFEEVSAKYATLQEEMATYMESNKALEEFKSNTEETEKNFRIEETINYAVECGMPKETAEEFRLKAVDFSFENIHVWSTEVKAETLQFAVKTENKESFNKIGLPYPTGKSNKKVSRWDKYK